MRLSPFGAGLVVFAIVALVAAGCAGSNTPTIAPDGAATTTSTTDTANSYLNEIESPSPATTGVGTQATTGSGPDVDFGQLNAIAVASVPGSWEYPLGGQCILTGPPLAPNGSPSPSSSPSPTGTPTGSAANPLTGTTIDVVLSDLSGFSTTGSGPETSTSPAPSSNPSPSTGVDASATPGPTTAPISDVYMSLALQQTAMMSPLNGTTSATASPSTSNPTATAPFLVGGPSDTVSNARIGLPNQGISNGILIGGAVASNARSGYVAFDANGQTVYVNFLCLNVSSFVNVSGPGASPSPSASPSIAPPTKEPKKTP